MINSGHLSLFPSLAALLGREEHGSLEPGEDLCLETFPTNLETHPSRTTLQAGAATAASLPPSRRKTLVFPFSEVSCSPGMKHLDGSMLLWCSPAHPSFPSGSHQQEQGEITP